MKETRSRGLPAGRGARAPTDHRIPTLAPFSCAQRRFPEGSRISVPAWAATVPGASWARRYYSRVDPSKYLLPPPLVTVVPVGLGCSRRVRSKTRRGKDVQDPRLHGPRRPYGEPPLDGLLVSRADWPPRDPRRAAGPSGVLGTRRAVLRTGPGCGGGLEGLRTRFTGLSGAQASWSTRSWESSMPTLPGFFTTPLPLPWGDGMCLTNDSCPFLLLPTRAVPRPDLGSGRCRDTSVRATLVCLVPTRNVEIEDKNQEKLFFSIKCVDLKEKKKLPPKHPT